MAAGISSPALTGLACVVATVARSAVPLAVTVESTSGVLWAGDTAVGATATGTSATGSSTPWVWPMISSRVRRRVPASSGHGGRGPAAAADDAANGARR